MSLITLITPTGGRPEAFALCQKYVARQTYKGPIQWIVVNDCPDQPIVQSSFLDAAKHVKQEVYIADKTWKRTLNNEEYTINTQRYNMEQAIKYVKGDFVFTIEDDDWYAPNFLEAMLYLLQKYDVVGQGNSHYYNIKERKYKEWKNYHHTSLNETGIKASKTKLLDRAVNSGNLFFDIALWEIVFNEGHNHIIFDWLRYVVGMKGLPGKFGIGGGHTPDPTFKDDKFFDVLRSWVGVADTTEYVKIAQTLQAKK